jgi:ferrous iron transport protein A
MTKTLLCDLREGDSATIVNVVPCPMCEKLLELGCLPGEPVRVEHVAPLGDPIAIRVTGSCFMLRKSDAKHIEVLLDRNA